MCNWRRPVCVECKIDMYPKKNGVPFVEQFKDGIEWKPYKVWESDMWTCSCCGISVLIGFGRKPTAHHSEETFEATLARAQEDPWVVVEMDKKGPT